MNRRSPIALAIFAVLVAACQGSFGSGGTAAPGGVAPPVNGQMPANAPPVNPSPRPSSAVATTPSGNTVTYAASEASKGLKCPEDQGFSCTLTLAVATPAPSGSPSASPSGSGSPSPSPSPTPTPTPTPTPSPMPSGSASGSPSPSPSPTSSGPHISLTIAGLPKNAPKMNDPNPKAVATVALVTLKIHTDADITLRGASQADFTLPKEQIGGRGFAVQLYQETTSKRKVSDRFVGSYSESKLTGTTLHFALATPATQIKKGETWMLVLYGDELPSSALPSASPSASSSASASPSGSPSVAPSGSPSASPVASPSATP